MAAEAGSKTNQGMHCGGPVAVPPLKRKRPPQIEIPTVLQEINRFDHMTSRNEAVSFSGLGVAVSAVKGRKKFMEDNHKIVSCLHGDSTQGFFGVYDGHGGRNAVEFVVENLHTNILGKMVNCTETDVREEAVKAAYLKTDQDFLERGLASGACCVTALIDGQEIVVSNLGDSRAVLCRGGAAEALTRDHRPEREDERKRIESTGGFVDIHRGAWRVHGVLSVSRSIGDAHLKNWVLGEPDTRILPLTPDMEFLVLASDGLWEEVGNQEAIDIVTRLCLADKKSRRERDGGKDDEADQYGCVNVSPSSKLRRVSLVKQHKGARHSQTDVNWKNGNDGFACENESPPSKLRRISLVKRMNMKAETPILASSGCKKKKGPPGSTSLVAACKELVNLAVSRGSLDDITVMIIDLKHFNCKS